MHGIKISLLEKQAAYLGYTLEIIYISKNSSYEEYESQMRTFLEKQIKNNINTAAFGDIFLEDLKKYREDKLRQVKMTALFPLRGQSTNQLVHKFARNGFKAIITCVDTEKVDASFSGRSLDNDFTRDLPQEVDPCGENGEFHSFVYDGLIFKQAINFTKGKTVLRDNRFSF